VELAIRYLARRRRFEREVRAHLRKRQVASRDIDEAILRLQELELVSDADTARAWIRDRMNFSPRGRALLRRELLAKGVAAPLADEALDELVGEEDESRAALELLRRSRAKWSGLAEAVARRRMWSALARRGFPSAVCRAALMEFAEETGIDANDEAWN